jgi:phosphoribosylformimino-5-aminoimidazole carboxamide ribonucleotide (ProFAR) isomerase
MISVVEKISEQVSIPLSVGGGIKSLDDFEKVFDYGDWRRKQKLFKLFLSKNNNIL